MNKKKYFNYFIILGVLIIPFMYSFFYLKAYWNPYGEGNIDNLPIAIVNNDKGKKGKEIVDNIISSKKLKVKLTDDKSAQKGLNNGVYYAIIDIPFDFSKNLDSISEENKLHPTITYSPNQKTNYLASQIINNVVNAVEKNLDNSINSTIVSNLEKSVTSVPKELEKISSGFDELSGGTNKLASGSQSLASGTSSLKENYEKFNSGVETLNNGINVLNDKVKGFDSLSSGIDSLTNGTSSLANGSNTLTSGLNSYVAGVSSTLDYTNNMITLTSNAICPKVASGTATAEEGTLCAIASSLSNGNIVNYLQISGNSILSGNQTINDGINSLNANIGSLSEVKTKINDLQNGVEELKNGSNTLYDSSLALKDGISSLNSGANELNSGMSLLNTSVSDAKNTLDTKINETNEKLKTVKGLSEYSKEPVNLKTKPVNEISSYGTAFSPFFISIALWVGCLMMFIVLYYDKEERFPLLSINYNDKLKRTFMYHGLATLAGVVLGITLDLFLEFEISNYFVYYTSLVLISNTFMAIMNFLITNFNDIGKFIGLILLVLQLAAAGGTFPIETVTKGFRWLHPILPMTYTNKLLKESLMTLESNLLTKYFTIVFVIFLIFFVTNIVIDIKKSKINKK